MGYYDKQRIYHSFTNGEERIDPRWIALRRMAHNYVNAWNDTEENRTNAKTLFETTLPDGHDAIDSMLVLREMAMAFTSLNMDTEKEIDGMKIAEIGYKTGLNFIIQQLNWVNEDYDYVAGSEFAKKTLEKYLLEEKNNLQKDINYIKRYIKELKN